MNNEKKILKNKIILRLGEILQDSDGILTLVKLNLLFIFTSLVFVPPVFLFTFGPAAAALTSCVSRMVKTGYQPDVRKNYLEIYKSCFSKTFLPGAGIVCVCAVFTAGLYIYITMASDNLMFIPMASVSLLALLVICGTAVHLFPVLCDEEDNSNTKEKIISAFSKMIAKLPSTLFAVVLSAAFITILILLLPATLPLILTLAFSVPALIMAFVHTEPEW